MADDLALVPHFIKEPSPEKLIAQMHRNNIRHGRTFKYFDISKQGAEWFAWYVRRRIARIVQRGTTLAVEGDDGS